MAYKFDPSTMYMMPTHFGQGLGPRQGPQKRKFECKDNPKSKSFSVSFLTNREQLEALLPERFEVGEEPLVTVFATYMKEIEWLAGRGYNVLGVNFPAIFKGERDHAVGDFLAVLWENLTDPILTGREQIGYSKIYCEIPEPSVLGGETHITASWLGFKFLDINLKEMTPLDRGQPPDRSEESRDEKPNDAVLKGMLHYKYMPRTGEWGTADASYAVLTPEENPNWTAKEESQGKGTVEFHKARWEDMPTQYLIVNGLQELEIKEYRDATYCKSVGGKDLSDQRILL